MVSKPPLARTTLGKPATNLRTTALPGATMTGAPGIAATGAFCVGGAVAVPTQLGLASMPAGRTPGHGFRRWMEQVQEHCRERMVQRL